ncbi:hypothetical protein ACE103_19310 [Bradyrhizobium sp. ma5]|uniref:hypothetical protein n=1 Tax=Bradyrhizobium sp. ma5 TaxID=3344828 RepID=UPI0035D45C56
MQSTLKDADPHDIFAIEPSFTATRTDNAAITPAPAGKVASGQREPWFGPSLAPSSTPPVAPAAPVASVPPVTPMPVTAPPAAPEYSTASHDGRLDDIRLERAPRPTSKWAIRAFWFLFAIAGAMGTAAWQHYGHRVKQVVAEYVPQVEALTSLLPGKATPAADQASPPAQAAAADQPAEAAPAAAPQDVAAAQPAATTAPVAAAAPVVPPAPADQTQLLQSMARDLASMGQQIEQLKTSIDQLKASQDQLTQRVARTTETRAVEPRPVAPRPRAAIAPPPAAPHTAVASPPVRRSYPPAQAYIPPPPAASAAPLPAPVAAAPQTVAPRPVQPQQSSVVDADDNGPVVRPPMPLR